MSSDEVAIRLFATTNLSRRGLSRAEPHLPLTHELDLDLELKLERVYL